MSQEKDISSREIFLKILRGDLSHLYDPEYLRQSPLLVLFGLTGRFDAPFALQNALIAEIESLHPGKNDPAAAQHRKLYELLHIRYVQQSGQEETATQFGLSIRQIRREQQAAIEFLSVQIWNKFSAKHQQFRQALKSQSNEDLGGIPTTPPGLETDLSWLKEGGIENPADPNILLPEIIDLVEPLARQKMVTVSWKSDEPLPLLAVRNVALRHALSNLLTLAIQLAPEKVVEIDTRVNGGFLAIIIQCTAEKIAADKIEEQRSTLEIVKQMIEIYKGQVKLDISPASFQSQLVLPILESVKVLVIDDNADFHQLIERYTDGTRYKPSSLQNPELAFQTALQILPDIIVLDVMMPKVDGWQVLRTLKNNPTTAKTAVVVCTIFAQKDLALTLGADDFAQKPITQESLLAALDRQAYRLGKTRTQSFE